MTREYIAAFKASPRDMVQAGVKGMRWGVRRDRAQLRAAAKARGDAPAKKAPEEKAPASSASSATKPKGNIQDNVESSADRYARLESQAKAGRASEMTEQDLKFFNARTEALTKINKLTEEQPSWLRDTATKVIQQSAQRQMQGLADTLADKYVGDPIKAAIKGAKD